MARRRKGTRNKGPIPVDTSSFTSDMTFWASDAYTDSRAHGRERFAWSSVAVVPTLPAGEEDGLVRRLQFEVEHWSSPQVELLGCLTAHVLARSNDELRPVIFNDFQAVEHLLDSVLGLRPFKRADRFTPLPQLFDLIEAMGDEVDYVHVHWLPRCSTPALKLVDSLVDRRLRDEREAPEVWSELTFDDLLIKAKGISA